MALADRLQRHDGDAPALEVGAESVSYAELRKRVDAFAGDLLGSGGDLGEERIAMLLPPDPDYVVALLAIWRAGGVAVPLSTRAAVSELARALESARATRLVSAGEMADSVEPCCRAMNIDVFPVCEPARVTPAAMPAISSNRRALMLFTSGTTSQPKGVVSSHGNVRAQITALVGAWCWSADDRIPLILPLHHVHGIINVLCCALWAGARVELLEGFDAGTVLGRVADNRYSVFMAVPTIYVKLIEALELMPSEERASACAGFAAMRLMVSGSAACPVGLHRRWRALTGQSLLERYGMTEIGMALSNPYDGERRPGTVGGPLPGVEVMLADEKGGRIAGDRQPGEIRVRGNNVFLEYWDDPEATAQAFADGWFRTGDIAERDRGYYRILGRSSIDIIKSGGYKLSALEIESVLLDHEAVAECAVVGLPDETWGEAVTAAVVLQRNATVSGDELRAWCKNSLSSYKVPKEVRFVDALPRNAMGKVTKQVVKALF